MCIRDRESLSKSVRTYRRTSQAIERRASTRNLNVGCGNNTIEGFINLDISSDHYHQNKKIDFIEYNMREDDLPCEDASVDNIYVSHVIEHIETEFVKKFICESHRVLKPGGVLRFACPDAEFLYEVSAFPNDYWLWRLNWYKNSKRSRKGTAYSNPQPMDFFIREISTRRSKFYVNSVSEMEREGTDLEGLTYTAVREELTRDLTFEVEHPNEHINAWDFSRLQKIGEAAGFSSVIRSKAGASVSKAMQGPDMDTTFPLMSLYVDMVK